MNFLRKLKIKNNYFKSKIINLYKKKIKSNFRNYPVLKYKVKFDLKTIFKNLNKKLKAKFFILKDNLYNP